ncbi:hypothetical protein [Leptolyngbya sp. Heron Island J]|uniref:hypothetical protein n=1 Tax=Leptolyngbya sp. Heron Island J TaxID=1385935 RepID=UPI000422436B|nr:hypothetical protein [Leptolyngbya sp. Heron Island J]
MLHVLRPYHLVFERLAIAFLFTFIIADLYPHPSLSPGLIMSTVSYLQSDATELVDHDTTTLNK